jgi:hypothetical protein
VNVLAVDPGRTTGFALCSADVGEIFHFNAWQEPDWVSAVWEVEQRRAWTQLVVCESFVISPQTVRKSQQTISLELIGAMRYLCARTNTEFKLQTPADAKRLGTDARLKALGWWTPGQDHARDATRHLLLALVTRGLIDPARLL